MSFRLPLTSEVRVLPWSEAQRLQWRLPSAPSVAGTPDQCAHHRHGRQRHANSRGFRRSDQVLGEVPG